MNTITRDENIESIFAREKRAKTNCYVKWNQVVIKDSSHVINLELGTCVAVVLCGIDSTNTLWMGVNHLFRCREENSDIALEHVATLYNEITDKKVANIRCLGVFGAGYSQTTIAKEVATKNIKTILEALSIYNLTIEIFQTGFRQSLSILASEQRKSFLIKHTNLSQKKSRFIELPLTQLFGESTSSRDRQ